MKNKLFIYVGLAASLLCSCAQSDVDNGQEQGKGQGSTVLHLSATATGGDATRVSVGEDATNGLITKWTSSDKLNVWNLYGSTLSKKDFKNSLTEGNDAQTTDFTCETSGTTFTPYSTIYAFNNLVSGGSGTYSQNNSSGTFTLNLSGYGGQNGTLANMNKYDALYGTTTANNDGSKNNSLTMNHLTTAMCFTLTNDDFNGTTLTKLTVNCGGTSTSILPASCTATLNAGGELAYTSRTGATKWTVTGSSIAATAGGAFKVYLMTFPFKNISGPLDFIVETSAGKYYTRYVTMNNLSLNAGTVYNRTVAMTEEQTVSVPSTFAKSNYYWWDAYAPVGTGSNTFSAGNYGYNPNPTSNEYGRVAEHRCILCPTAKEIYAYLLAGAYWDDGSAIKLDDGSYSYPPSYTIENAGSANNTVTYNNYIQNTNTRASGSSQGRGLWLPKNSYIKSNLYGKLSLTKGHGVEDYTGSVYTNNFSPTVINASNAATIRKNGNYFFLPAAGYYSDGTSSSVSFPGSSGYYWSSSTYSSSYAYYLYFSSGNVYLNDNYRYNGFLLWGVQ